MKKMKFHVDSFDIVLSGQVHDNHSFASFISGLILGSIDMC